LNACPAGSSVAAPRFANDPRSGLPGALSGQIDAPIVDHDHLVGDLTRHGAYDCSNGVFFVQGWDHD
jgi:hypothetical protein